MKYSKVKIVFESSQSFKNLDSKEGLGVTSNLVKLSFIRPQTIAGICARIMGFETSLEMIKNIDGSDNLKMAQKHLIEIEAGRHFKVFIDTKKSSWATPFMRGKGSGSFICGHLNLGDVKKYWDGMIPILMTKEECLDLLNSNVNKDTLLKKYQLNTNNLNNLLIKAKDSDDLKEKKAFLEDNGYTQNLDKVQELIVFGKEGKYTSINDSQNTSKAISRGTNSSRFFSHGFPLSDKCKISDMVDSVSRSKETELLNVTDFVKRTDGSGERSFNAYTNKYGEIEIDIPTSLIENSIGDIGCFRVGKKGIAWIKDIS